jgi:ABC-type transport system involved in multi-copper enzyme maturation permease subunit
MVWIIVRKEFLSNLVNFRFIAGFILCFMLSVLSAWILTQDYAERVAEYSDSVQRHKEDLYNARVYSQVKVTLDKLPEPLGLLCEGVEKYLNGTVTVEHGETPEVTSSAGQGNPLMAGLASLDLSLIVQVIFSLLALLFVYDSISRERERGTLALLISNPVPRHQVLLGKYLGILLSLFVPILFSLLAGALIILLSPSVKLSSSDGIRLILISVISILYVSVFCGVGLFVSARCSRSRTSLMILLFLWVTFILLIPKASQYVASYAKPVSSLDVFGERVGVLRRELSDKVNEFTKEHPVQGSSSFDSGGNTGRVFMGEKRKMMAYLELARFREPLRIDYADKEHLVRQEYLRELEGQSALANNLARISPSVGYENLVSALAKTDARSHLMFIERARNYRRELISYLQSKKALTSLLYFTRMKEEDMADSAEYYEMSGKLWNEWQRQIEGGKKITQIWKDIWDEMEPLDLSGLPEFEFKGPSILANIGYTMPDLVILVVMNLLFFMLAYVSFLRGGVKI